MKFILLALTFLSFSALSTQAHCQKCKADGSELIKKARQVR